MTYSDEDIARQLRLGEDSGWEFKEVGFTGERPSSPRRDDWADEIGAFANSDGGVLLCGVRDDGTVQGMSREQMDALERLLVELCTDSIRPPIRVDIFRKESADGAAFLLVEIPAGYALHESPGGNFVRVGSSKRRISGDEQLRLAERRGQARFIWFDKQPVPETGFGTLDEALWKPLLSVAGAVDPAIGLEKMGLLARDEHGTVRATVAGILLCCREPEQWLPNACITATRYRGNDRSSGQLDAQTIGGPINRQVTEALTFALRNMQVAARKNPGREELPQYSASALFEALVNAVAHRDYSISGSKIRISLFEDRLEISSPGGLPNNLTIESMGERQSTRNEVLTSVLGRINADGIAGADERQFFIERRGDGVTIIRRETEALCGVPPEFRLIDDAELRLTIPAASLEPTPATPVVAVRCDGAPLPGADILALFPNKTWRRASTDANGTASVALHSTHLPMTVFAAAPGVSAGQVTSWIPAEEALAIELDALPDGGSILFSEETGDVPGLDGRLNPIRDALDRTYLYASNIAINGGQPQPVAFRLGEPLQLTDAAGRAVQVRIVNIVGRSALIEYRSAQTTP